MMGRIPESPIKRTFMEVVGFTKIAEIHPDVVEEFGWKHAGIDRVMIMPDVNSIHIFWEEADGSYWHNIHDYPYPDEDITLEDWMDEWTDCSYGQVYGIDLTDIATEGGSYKMYADGTGYLLLKQLKPAHERMESAFRLVDMLENGLA